MAWRQTCGFVFVAVLGCSDDGGVPYAAEDPGELAAALGESCADAVPQAIFNGPPNYRSPRTYNPPDCFKGQVVEFVSGSGGSGAVGAVATTGLVAGSGASTTFYGVGGATASVRVSWADHPPTTQAACEVAWAFSYLFERTPAGTFTVRESRSAKGTWRSGSCDVPKIPFGLTVGKRYRVAATARVQETSGAATRTLSVTGN